jgi:hypothetical protein
MIWLISYPRSGNTFFRYVIEWITGQPTDGTCDNPNPPNRLMYPLIHEGRTDFYLYKSHTWTAKPEDKVIFLLRDPIEVFVRHYKSKDFETFKKYVPDYMKLIQRFDEHANYRQLYYYEDVINGVFDHFSYQWQGKVNRHLLHLKQGALKLYPGSKSKGSGHIFHSKDIERYKWNGYIKDQYPELFDKYLLRYE